MMHMSLDTKYKYLSSNPSMLWCHMSKIQFNKIVAETCA